MSDPICKYALFALIAVLSLLFCANHRICKDKTLFDGVDELRLEIAEMEADMDELLMRIEEAIR
ncbi:MAG: hypothetical protein JW885_02680 [Deltaproteobacteria bacterium]|nr:hypothetical protein [Candidatus Zymogenaceae bacterium]